MASAEYMRQWRARRGARTGHPGRPVTQPHGTAAAYKRHRYNREPPCDLCKAAWAHQQRVRYQRTKDLRPASGTAKQPKQKETS